MNEKAVVGSSEGHPGMERLGICLFSRTYSLNYKGPLLVMLPSCENSIKFSFISTKHLPILDYDDLAIILLYHRLLIGNVPLKLFP